MGVRVRIVLPFKKRELIPWGEKNLSVKIECDKNHTHTEGHQDDMNLPESEDMSPVVISDDMSSREYLEMSPSEEHHDDINPTDDFQMSPLLLSDEHQDDMSLPESNGDMSPLVLSEDNQDDTSLPDFEDMPPLVLSEDDEPTTCTIDRNVAATVTHKDSTLDKTQ